MSVHPASGARPSERDGRLAVETRDGPAGSRIEVRGELDLSTVPVLAEPLRSAAGSDHADLIVDFRRVTFCDLAGLNLLADVAARLRADGRRLVVYGPCSSLQVLLDLLGSAAPVEMTPAPRA